MKQLTCEMCGGTDLLKQDGVFVCQYCGTKYSVEEARKMMIDVTGSTVKVDTREKLDNLYQLARRAKEDDNSANAIMYYSQILLEKPNDWEATFYSVYFKAASCKLGEMQSEAYDLDKCSISTMKLIKEQLIGEEQIKAYKEVAQRIIPIVHSYIETATLNSSNQFINYKSITTNATYMGIHLGDQLLELYNDKELALKAYETASKCGKWHTTLTQQEEDDLHDKIKKLNPSHEVPKYASNNTGCYVATAVYGSYDCPQVWTLRRYRDYTLAGTWYGRAFIHIYYAISPTLVKWFGHTEWFKKMWKSKLDCIVSTLQSQGVEDTPYESGFVQQRDNLLEIFF